MSWATRVSPIRVGDTIAYSKRFLCSKRLQKCLDCEFDDMDQARGRVIAIEPLGETILARIDWNTPGLPVRVNVKNLSLIKNGMVMEHC